MKAEFADRELFGSLREAKVLGAGYKRYWNQERLHSGIGYQRPAEFAAELWAGLRYAPSAPKFAQHHNRLS